MPVDAIPLAAIPGTHLPTSYRWPTHELFLPGRPMLAPYWVDTPTEPTDPLLEVKDNKPAGLPNDLLVNGRPIEEITY